MHLSKQVLAERRETMKSDFTFQPMKDGAHRGSCNTNEEEINLMATLGGGILSEGLNNVAHF